MPQQYTVLQGDTLFNIAQRLLSDGSRWTEITDQNGKTFTEEEAKNLQPGVTVTVPDN